MVSMLLETSLSQTSMHIQIFITVKASFFWKGIQQSIQQLDYCNKTSKETDQRLSLFGSSHWEPDRYSEFFLSKSLKNTFERIHFWQCCRLQTRSFTKKVILSQAFLKDFAYRFSWENDRTAILKKPFQSEHFLWLLLFMPTISKKTKEVNILKV